MSTSEFESKVPGNQATNASRFVAKCYMTLAPWILYALGITREWRSIRPGTYEIGSRVFILKMRVSISALVRSAISDGGGPECGRSDEIRTNPFSRGHGWRRTKPRSSPLRIDEIMAVLEDWEVHHRIGFGQSLPQRGDDAQVKGEGLGGLVAESAIQAMYLIENPESRQTEVENAVVAPLERQSGTLQRRRKHHRYRDTDDETARKRNAKGYIASMNF
ncbi:hypothetical protein DFH06DRAFT_1147420 [Mycena polygramma]|nr:hypothetical protein DFH06DRAFT_1147420 [Mycena polygramma]